MGAVFLYALCEPGPSGAVRYIGKTTNPKKRLRGHISDAKTENNHRAHWINSLLKRGLRPELEMLAQVPATNWQQWEIDYIAAFLSMGFNLVNATEGGDGFKGGEEHPCFGKPGLRRGMASWNKGVCHTEETCLKISAARKGWRATPEQRQQRSARLRGRPSFMLGKRHSPETKARMSAAHRAAPANAGNFKSGQVPWNKGRKKYGRSKLSGASSGR